MCNEYRNKIEFVSGFTYTIVYDGHTYKFSKSQIPVINASYGVRDVQISIDEAPEKVYNYYLNGVFQEFLVCTVEMI